MISVHIDREEPVALHDQVAAEIRKAIAEGEAVPGERLPLAKDIAAILGVNKNTVLRAMHILREEGLLEFSRGRGVTVVGEPARGLVVSRAREFIAFARQYGYRRSDLLRLIQELP
jgi:GntR family transcriptional regulator